MFKRLCYENSFSNKNNLSHVLMDGGSLSVPFDKLNVFYDLYIKCLKADEPVFIVEQLTDTYNFFVDIDYKDDVALTLEQVESITQIICDKVQTFGGSKCLISVAEPKPKDGLIKTGIHMNWPGFVVNQNGALQLRHHIISTLSKIYTARNWDQDVDSSVYGNIGKKGSGFRLLWSHKMIDKKVEGVYLPISLYTNGKMEDTTQEPTLEMINYATVRTDNPNFVEIPELVVLCQIINTNSKRKEGDFKKSETKNEIYNSELVRLLEEYIQKYMNQSIKIYNIFKFKNIFLLKTNSKYCENIKREHSSNHIKLQIEYRLRCWVIYQKCFCTCSDKTCKDYEGRPRTLTPTICKHLENHLKK